MVLATLLAPMPDHARERDRQTGDQDAQHDGDREHHTEVGDDPCEGQALAARDRHALQCTGAARDPT